MELTLDPNSWMAKFYRWSYGESAYTCEFNKSTYDYDWNVSMPKSICGYSWSLLIALLLLPVTWITWVVQKLAKEDNWDYTLGKRFWHSCGYCVLLVLISLVTYVIATHLSGTGWVLLIILGFVVFIALLLGIRELILNGVDALPETEVYKVASGTVYSIKNKVCPRINWKKEEKAHGKEEN